MRFLVFLTLVFISSVSFSEGLSQEEIAEMKDKASKQPINTYLFIGNTIVCKTDEKHKDDNDACSRIGPVKVGDTFNPKAEAWKVVPQPNGVTASVYPIVADDKYNAYWVIGHKDKKIVSVQLTGNYPDADLSFATIQLADSEDKVKSILGPRFISNEVPEIGGQIWDYYPFPITIEFKDGSVYSIRVAEN